MTSSLWVATRGSEDTPAHDTNPRIGPVERWMTAAALALLGVLTVYLLLRQSTSFVDEPNKEIIAHGLASGSFTAVASGFWILWRNSSMKPVAMLIAGAGLTVVFELLQWFAPLRTVQLRDIAAGFAGVLVTTVALQILLATRSNHAGLRWHAFAAVVGSLLIGGSLLISEPRQPQISSVRPDGVACPLTSIERATTRFDLTSASTRTSPDCISTNSGGLGVHRRADRSDLVFVSSDIAGLQDRVRAAGGVRIAISLEATELSPAPATIFTLHSARAGRVVALRATSDRLEVIGPENDDRLSTLVYAEVLRADGEQIVEVELRGMTLRLIVDAVVAGSATLSDEWLDRLTSDDLRLVVGGNVSGNRPFTGEISWIELEAGT